MSVGGPGLVDSAGDDGRGGSTASARSAARCARGNAGGRSSGRPWKRLPRRQLWNGRLGYCWFRWSAAHGAGGDAGGGSAGLGEGLGLRRRSASPPTARIWAS